MNLRIFETTAELAKAAAADGASAIRAALAAQGQAAVVFACAGSQIEMLASLITAPDIDWQRVKVFHLDEYVGLPFTHPASFRHFLWKRVISQLPVPPQSVWYLNGQTDPHGECQRAGAAIAQEHIDVAFIGIGENGHLAFNDPPADFETRAPYIVVNLDEACRRQQVGEGWYAMLEDVPRQAISMSIHQILQSAQLICTVPDARKSAAVKAAVEGPVTSMAPASRLQQHPCVILYLDHPSADELSSQKRQE